MSAPSRRLPIQLVVAATAPNGPSCPAELPPTRERLEAWFCDYFDTLWRLALRLGVPRGQVDDVVQEAFITAERRAADISVGSERRFLVSTLIKLSANARRRHETRQQLLESLVHDAERSIDAEQLLAGKQLLQGVDLALGELPEEQRAVLVLYEIEGFSVPEIADLLDVPSGTVASRLARARSKFSRAAARLRSLWPERF